MSTDTKQFEILYSEIENEPDYVIDLLINRTLTDPFPYCGTASLLGFPLYRVLRRRFFDKEPPKDIGEKSLKDICVDCANTVENKNKIKLILQNNHQSTNFVIGIIQLLAPAIAQQYSGIPAMAIVGAITLLCRQGLENYLKE